MKSFTCSCVMAIFMLHATAQTFSVLKDIRPGIASSFADYLMLAGNKLFFSATDSVHGYELWASAGTPATTKMVLDLNPGTASSSPQNIISMNGAIYFTANDGISGKELWKIDETGNPLRLTNTTVSSPFYWEGSFMVYHHQLYFSFDDGIHGREVWKTNGTVAGTSLVKDVRAGAVSTALGDFFIYRDKLFYAGLDDTDTQALYAIDDINGTNGRVFNCGEGGCSAFTIFRDTLFFFSDDNIFSSPRNELYRSDGTTAGTKKVTQINANAPGTYFGQIAVANDRMFFSADDGIHGIELWKSDGTSQGTAMVRDIHPGPADGTPSDLVAFNNKILFQAYLQPGDGATWVTDGTGIGTTPLSPMIIAYSGRNTIEIAGKLYFQAYIPGAGFELAVTDGTPQGTKLALDIFKGIFSGSPDRFTPRGDAVYFVANDEVKGYEVYSISAEAGLQTLPAAATAVMETTNTLAQNFPNPCEGSTTINYILPEQYITASLSFSNSSGHNVKTLALTGHGAGKAVVATCGLAPGVYFYSLVVDGKRIASKSCFIER